MNTNQSIFQFVCIVFICFSITSCNKNFTKTNNGAEIVVKQQHKKITKSIEFITSKTIKISQRNTDSLPKTGDTSLICKKSFQKN